MASPRANTEQNCRRYYYYCQSNMFFLDKPIDHFGEKNPVITAEAESSVDDESLDKQKEMSNSEPQPFLR